MYLFYYFLYFSLVRRVVLHITGFRVICLTGCYFQVYEYELAAFAVSSFFYVRVSVI